MYPGFYPSKQIQDKDLSMKNFMEPNSVAIIGISRKTGPGSFNLMENMISFGFSGKIFPVNPQAQEILGRKVYPSVRSVKDKIDLAIISTPREDTLSCLKDCVAARIEAAIVVNQGFSDADTRGKAIQKEMTEMAKRHGIRILGPNTLGVLNNFSNFTTSFMPLSRERAPVGLICQSGIFFVGARVFSGVIGKGIDLGNACDIDFCDALRYLAEDPDIKIIAIHMEGLERAKDFLAIANNTVKKKPIIILKTGSSETGSKAALSHSGSIAGNFEIYRTALNQAGVTFLEKDGQIFPAVKTLLNLPTLKGNRVAVVTFSGAAGIMIVDALERYGLKVGTLSPKTIETVAELSPDWMPLGNPLDIWPAVMKHGAERAYSIALRAVMNDPHIDGVIGVATAPVIPEFSFLDVSEALNSIIEELPRKPVLFWLYGPNHEEIGRRFESKNRIMTYPTLDTAAWSLSLLKERGELLVSAGSST
jgi:acyl-CoA synthetase (NDP forming)